MKILKDLQKKNEDPHLTAHYTITQQTESKSAADGAPPAKLTTSHPEYSAARGNW